MLVRIIPTTRKMVKMSAFLKRKVSNLSAFSDALISIESPLS